MEKEKMARLLYLLCIIFGTIKLGECQCRAAEEGTAYNITGCTFTPTNDTTNYTELTWMAVINNTATPISSCSPDGKCNSLYQGFTAKIDNNKSYMIVEKVSRLEQGRQFNVETTWSCQWSPLPSVNICSPLRVFAKPKSLKCNFESFTLNGKQLTCATDQMYPDVGCEWQFSRDNVSFTNCYLGNNTNKFTLGDKTPAYFTNTCTFNNIGCFYVGKNYFKALVNYFTPAGSAYTVSSDVGQITLDLDQGYTTAQQVTSSKPTTQEKDTQAVATSTTTASVETDTSAVIGLGVTTGLLACAVVALTVVVACLWWRHKQEGCWKKQRQTSYPVIEGYDRPQNVQQKEGQNAYAAYEVGNNVTGAYANSQSRGQYEPNNYENLKGVYANAQPRGRYEADNYQNLKGVYGNNQPRGKFKPDTYLNLTGAKHGVATANNQEDTIYEN